MHGEAFRLLILADLHDGPAIPEAKHFPHLGLSNALAAIDDAARRGRFDCIIMPGDLVDDGRREDTPQRLAEIRDAIRAAAPGVPLLVVPGNHDGPPEKVFEIFGAHGGLHEMGGYRFVVLFDRLTEKGWTRTADQMQVLEDVAGYNGQDLIVVQHHPLGLTFESAAFFMVSNYADVVRQYARLGVMLCIGAHCHAGDVLSETGGVRYFTAPSLCNKPFHYAILTLQGRNVSVGVWEVAT